MDKVLNYLALARKAGKAELGEEPVGAAARALHAHLIVVASDASDATTIRCAWRALAAAPTGSSPSSALPAFRANAK